MSSSGDAHKVIGTHSGKFHADEVCACFMLCNHIPEFKDATILRSRDCAKLSKADILVDVGSVYDVGERRFDHHQKGFAETFDRSHKTKLSSAGLIYKHFGRAVVASMLRANARWETHPIDEANIEVLYQRFYDGFVEGVDAVDNGVEMYRASVLGAHCVAQYKDATTVSRRVSRLNAMWTEALTNAQMFERFKEAMRIVGDEMTGILQQLAWAWLPSREIVRAAIGDRLSVHGSGAIVQLPQYCPWISHLFELEVELKLSDEILFVLFPESGTDLSGPFRVRAVPSSAESFSLRCPLAAKFRGIRGEELVEASGIVGAEWVHVSGFIGGAKTQGAALRMAVASMPKASDSVSSEPSLKKRIVPT